MAGGSAISASASSPRRAPSANESFRRRSCGTSSRYSRLRGRSSRSAIGAIDDSRREARVEHGQQLVTDAMRGIARSAFEASSRNVNPGGAQKLADVRARRFEERPYDDARARMDAAQAPRPCAAQQPKEERLGLVVFRVGDGDGGRSEARSRAIEKRVPRGVRRVFD